MCVNGSVVCIKTQIKMVNGKVVIVVRKSTDIGRPTNCNAAKSNKKYTMQS